MHVTKTSRIRRTICRVAAERIPSPRRSVHADAIICWQRAAEAVHRSHWLNTHCKQQRRPAVTINNVCRMQQDTCHSTFLLARRVLSFIVVFDPRPHFRQFYRGRQACKVITRKTGKAKICAVFALSIKICAVA